MSRYASHSHLDDNGHTTNLTATCSLTLNNGLDGQLRIYGDIKTSRKGKERLTKETGCSGINITFILTNNRE